MGEPEGDAVSFLGVQLEPCLSGAGVLGDSGALDGGRFLVSCESFVAKRNVVTSRSFVTRLSSKACPRDHTQTASMVEAQPVVCVCVTCVLC